LSDEFKMPKLYIKNSLILIFFISALPGVIGQSSPSEIRDTLREWVRIESEISSESAHWSAEKQILKDRIALLEAEESKLREEIDTAAASVGELDKKRMEIRVQREALKQAMETIKEPLGKFESSVRKLYASFPVPLQEETQRLFERIPESGHSSGLSVTERLQAVVGLLNFADKFNSGVQREVEIRSIDGKQVEVQTLYFGMAGAYYADTSGTNAGVGYPSETGWQWQESPEHAEGIARLIAVYSGSREAAFVPVPVDIP
jgi:predicted hydrocarbon binding protein